MGKHERQLIGEAEKIIVKILNSKRISESDKKNYWFKQACAIAAKIKKDFPHFTKVTHLGNRYDNIGDILVSSNGDGYFIEVKMSDTKTGIGTKANISQDALTENSLFAGKVISWSKFRQKKRHEKWVNDYLNCFDKYPKNILEISNKILQKEEKARYLRSLADKGNKKAKSILDNIQKRDKGEKLAYLNFLKKQSQNKKMIKRFLVLILGGIHKKEALRDLIIKENFIKEIKNFIVYYGNRYKGKIIIRRDNTGDRIQNLLKRYSSFRIIFPKNLTHCKIAGIKNGSIEPLLQVVFHWKNIAQGIKTPCLNIFDLTL